MVRTSSKVSDIKRAQKESTLLKEISLLYSQAVLDDVRLVGLSLTRVKLSPDKGVCTVYFYSSEGENQFNSLLPILKLYKPSLRKALASQVASRYTPELIFAFDKTFEKQQRIEHLLDQVKE